MFKRIFVLGMLFCISALLQGCEKNITNVRVEIDERSDTMSAPDTVRVTDTVYVTPPDTTTTGKATGITVSPATATLKMCAGAPAPTQQFSALVLPSTVSQAVSWRVNNPSVASIDANGLAIAKSLGQTLITARWVSDTTIVRNATLIINNEGCGVAKADSTIEIVPGTITVSKGQTATPTVVCRINGAITGACQPWYRSTVEEVAVVGPSSGIVTAIKPGTTQIIVQWSMLKQFPADTTVVVVPSG